MNAEVADRVRYDWSYEQRREANEAVFERLAARYAVALEDAAPIAPVSANVEGRT